MKRTKFGKRYWGEDIWRKTKKSIRQEIRHIIKLDTIKEYKEVA